MMNAQYEVKPIVPALSGALVTFAISMLAGIAAAALLPATGWEPKTAMPITLRAYELYRMIWENWKLGYPVGAVENDLSAPLLIFAVAIGLCASIAGIVAFVLVHRATAFVDTRLHYDGPRFLKDGRAGAAAASAMAKQRVAGERPIELAPGVAYPRLWRVLNLLVVGAIGSGKTRIVLFLIEQLLGQVRASRTPLHGLLLYDTTGEILEGLPLDDSLFAALHPHRPGGYGWAIGRDLETISDMEAAADQAVQSTGQDMWGKGASDVAVGCMRIAQADGGAGWGFEQFYHAALLPPAEMKARFEKLHPLAASLLEFDADGEPSRTSISFLLTFRSAVLRTLRPLAEAWGGLPPGKLVSFKDWVRQTGVQPKTILVQRSGRYGAMSALWIGMALDTVVAQIGDPDWKNSQARTRTLVLDELPTLGRLNRLDDLLDTGRNKGICTIAAIQDLSQLDRLYGDYAPSLKARFRLKIFGAQTPGPDLVELSEKSIGTRRVRDRSSQTTTTIGPSGTTTQTSPNDRIDTAPIVPPDHLAYELGVRRKRVRAVLVGLGAVMQLTWPMRIWHRRR